MTITVFISIVTPNGLRKSSSFLLVRKLSNFEKQKTLGLKFVYVLISIPLGFLAIIVYILIIHALNIYVI